MHRMSKIKSIFLALLGGAFLFLFNTPVFAGGQMYSIEADSYGATNDDGTYGRIIRFISQAKPCEGTIITFKFVDPKDGDYIMTSSGNATFTFTANREPYYKNGEQVCGTTAKMGSKVKGERDVTVVVTDTANNSLAQPPIIKVDFDGQYHADNSYNGYNYRSSQDDPYYVAGYRGTPEMVYPVDNQTLDLEGAYMFKVKPVTGSSGYLFGLFQDGQMVYENYRDTRTLSSNGEFALWETNPFHAKFHTGPVSVWVRAYVNNQWTDARIITINLTPRCNGCPVPVPTSQPSGLPTPSIQPYPQVTPPAIPPGQIVVVTDSSASAALQNKVDELQKKLEESQQRQGLLERQLNQIVNWIKSIFPFFR